MKLKNFLSAILAGVIVFACTSTAFAQEYVLVYNDIRDMIKLPYTFADTIPEECGDYFEELLKNPQITTRKGTRAYDFFVIGDTFGFTAESFGSNQILKSEHTSSNLKLVAVEENYLIAGILEKDSGNILGLELLGQHYDVIEVYRDKIFKLPNYFDFEKHRVVFFTYVLRFNVINYMDSVYERSDIYVRDPVYVDVGNYIYGDANKDGKVNLTDVTLMLKYMARWSTVKVDTSLLDTEHSNISERNCWYNIPAVIRTLKIIAGWNSTYTSGAIDADACSAAWYIETK